MFSLVFSLVFPNTALNGFTTRFLIVMITAHKTDNPKPIKKRLRSVDGVGKEKLEKRTSNAPNIRYSPGIYSPKNIIKSPKTVTIHLSNQNINFNTKNIPVATIVKTFPILVSNDVD